MGLRSALVYTLAAVVASCANEPEPGPDAAVQDGGSIRDGGFESDGGAPRDGGATRDAGEELDAGTVRDGGAVSFELPTGVQPLYPTAVVDGWNDYALNDGPSVLEATGLPCDPAITGGYVACLHVGEMRSVEIRGVTDCTGLTASDSLRAFDWRCDDSSGDVRMVAERLADQRFLSDLIDLAASPPAWRPNAVTVSAGTTSVSSTPAVWWPNPVTVDNDGGRLATAGTIYVVTATPTADYSIEEDRVGLVVAPGLAAHVVATGRSFLWIEGHMVEGGDEEAIIVDGVAFSVLRNVSASGTTSDGVLLTDSRNNMLAYVSVTGAGEAGIAIARSAWNTLWRVNAVSNRRSGIELSSSQHTNVMEAVVANNGFHGLHLNFSAYSRVALLLAANNHDSGVVVINSGRSTLIGVTSIDNAGYGFYSIQNLGLTLASVAVVNNRFGAKLGDTTPSISAHYHTVADLLVAHNQFGILVENSNRNFFLGLLETSRDTTCTITGTSPGLVSDTCANEGVSTATRVVDVDATASFIGKITRDDLLNGSDVDGLAMTDIAPRDWFTFDNPLRAWGPDRPVPFLDASLRDRCYGLCRIFDFSLASGDPVLQGVLAPPTGDEVLDHIWSTGGQASCLDVPFAVPDFDACSLPGYLTQGACEGAGATWAAGNCGTRFLRNAVELFADGIGNDNSLCESGEDCLSLANIGRYQGHGALLRADAFQDGRLSNIHMFTHASQGR